MSCVATTASSTYYTGGPQPQWQSGTGAEPSASTSGQPGAAWPLPPDMNSGVYSSPRDQPTPPPAPNETLVLSRGTFTYEELAAATGGFSQANLLGQGGFGYVHKGVLPSGRAVAVKQLKSGSGQGEREFQAEVDIIGRVHHRHLVSLVGHCIAGTSRMLVYEFVPNKTLDFHLHGQFLCLRCRALHTAWVHPVHTELLTVAVLRCRERVAGDDMGDEAAHRAWGGEGTRLPARRL